MSWAAAVLLFVEVALLGVLLFRMMQKELRWQYCIFISYVIYQLSLSVAVFFVHFYRPSLYLSFYWYIQFVSVALGFAVIWEIFSHALSEFPGTLTLARLVVSIFFIAVLLIALIDAFSGGGSSLAKSVIGFERNLREIQAILLILLFALIWLYRIPLGLNLRGLAIGYAFLTGMSVLILALRVYRGIEFQLWWQFLEQSSYIGSLIIWVFSFWFPRPSPRFEIASGEVEEYSAIVEASSQRLASAIHIIRRVFQG